MPHPPIKLGHTFYESHYLTMNMLEILQRILGEYNNLTATEL